jgi:hypothetical protein
LAVDNAPAQLKLNLALAGTQVKTSYPLWVYPANVDITPPSNVTLARSFDSAARAKLAAGGIVALVCDGRPLARTVGGGSFATDFWNFRFFYNKPGTMGILCDPTNPAFARFPTESHSNWQWFDVALNAQPLVLDEIVPAFYVPTVQVVDNYERCHKLGLVFEALVGPGRLLVCASDLVGLAADHPAARQLLAGLLAYAGSNAFNPQTEISEQSLHRILRPLVPMTGCKATASSTEDSWHGYSADQLIDGNDERGWHADPAATGDCWCQIVLPAPTDLAGAEVLWDVDMPGYKYVVQGSPDGASWQTLSDQTNNAFKLARQDLEFTASGIRFVKIAIAGVPYHDHAPAIMEIRLFPPES